METELRIDKLGRLVIPKAMRDELGIRPGDRLVGVTESGRLEIKAKPASNPMKKEHGVWVYYPEAAAPVDSLDVLAETREERARKLAR